MKQRINVTQAYVHSYCYCMEMGAPSLADSALEKVQSGQTMEYGAREAMQILGGGLNGLS